MGERAHGEVLSLAFAGEGRIQDTGAKMIHVAPNTTSRIIAKSVAKDGGTATYRGLIDVKPGAINATANIQCDTLLLDNDSISNTYPTMKDAEGQAMIAHEASVSKVGDEQLMYMRSRGFDEKTATSLIVNGFFDEIVKTLPMEYAVEFNRLIELEMEGSLG